MRLNCLLLAGIGSPVALFTGNPILIGLAVVGWIGVLVFVVKDTFWLLGE